ncbi:MAG: hypothetical protein JWM36_2114 [Hyphomicrobiales bacterium]|nr:hypothetical protein [Hyphomicrobiales bacterium]
MTPAPIEPELLKRLDAVLAASSRHRMALSEIQIPLARYPNLAHTFGHVPIVDSLAPAVRLVYSAGPASQEARQH